MSMISDVPCDPKAPAPGAAAAASADGGGGAGAAPRGPMARVQAAAAKLLHLPDPSVVTVVLGVSVANAIEGDPVWLNLVDPPSKGKTELLMAAACTPHSYLISSLTKNTFASGATRKSEDGQEIETSLLGRLKQRGTRQLVAKDFGTVLNGSRDERNAILGQLREIFDGKFVKPFGTGKEVVWEGKLGWLGGVTSDFDRHSAVQTILGQRFLLHRLPVSSRQDRRCQSRHALAAAGHEKQLREAFGQAMRSAYEDALRWYESYQARITIPDEVLEELTILADLAAYGRAGVLRDHNHEVRYVPEPEGPGRLVKQLKQLLLGLLAAHSEEQPTEAIRAIVRRVARDTMHPFKARVLAALAQGDLSTTNLAQAAGLPNYATARRQAEDLRLLDLVTGNDDHWHLKDEWQVDIQVCHIFEGFPWPRPVAEGPSGPSQPPDSAASSSSRNAPPEGERGGIGGSRGYVAGAAADGSAAGRPDPLDWLTSEVTDRDV